MKLYLDKLFDLSVNNRCDDMIKNKIINEEITIKKQKSLMDY